MADEVPYFWKSLDWDALMADYPPPPLFERAMAVRSDDEVLALQEKRVLARVRDAWKVPFYRRRWSAAGLDEHSIKSLEDFRQIPSFTSTDLKAAIEAAPPFGDHHPFDRESMAEYLPLKIQTSGGTTGLPRSTLFDSAAWEIQGIQTARGLWAMGARPGDVIQIPFTASLANAAWCYYLGVHHWLGAIPVTTGSGVVTPSERQLELAVAYGTNGWMGHGEYLGRLVEVAGSMNLDLHSLPTKYLHALLGSDGNGELRRALAEAWGAPVYDTYGTHEIGLVAFECKHQNGRHVSEDTAYLETVDVENTSRALPYGEVGDLVATSLYRGVPPMIRFNTQDALSILPRERCECGLRTSRLSGLEGRSDEMVKLRGQNVFPMAVQDPVRADGRTNGQFLCVLTNVGSGVNRTTEMTVRVERRGSDIDSATLQRDMEGSLKTALNVRVGVEVVEPGALTEFTRLGGEGKVRRLLDLRRK